MIRFSKLVLMSVLLVGILCVCVCAEQFMDSQTNFALNVPSGWISQNTEDVGSFVGPKGIAQVNISKETVEGVTLEQFAKVFPSEMKKQLKSFKVVSSAKTKVGGLPARVWVYTAKIDGVDLKFKNVIIFRNGQMYNVVFCTIPQRYASDVAGFDAMLKSWSWSVS